MADKGQDYKRNILELLLQTRASSGMMSTIRSRGISMLPTILPDEEIEIIHCPIEDTRMGDIVVFRAKGKLYVHRLVKKVGKGDETLIFEKGDNFVHIGCVRSEDYLGRVESIKTEQGFIDLKSRGSRVLGSMLAFYGRLMVRMYKGVSFLTRNLLSRISPRAASRINHAFAWTLNAPSYLTIKAARVILTKSGQN
ncbi:S24/S26 family peptidase [Acidobacteriota bacterium]